MKDRKNIFISHIHDNDHRLPELKRLLAEHGLDVRDASINSLRPNNAQNEEYIKYEILAPRIDWAGVLVVLITADTRNSDYVNWEIEYASRHDTRSVASAQLCATVTIETLRIRHCARYWVRAESVSRVLHVGDMQAGHTEKGGYRRLDCWHRDKEIGPAGPRGLCDARDRDANV
jgi:hypothetical protein